MKPKNDAVAIKKAEERIKELEQNIEFIKAEMAETQDHCTVLEQQKYELELQSAKHMDIIKELSRKREILMI